MQIIGVSDRFLAPAPGSWELDSTHMTRPLSRYACDTIPQRATEGFRAGTKQYGLLLDAMEFATINGFMYSCARGVGAPKGAKGPPPKFIFKLLLRLHPELRRRVKRCAEVFETKAWREDVARWDNEWKPAIARQNSALQSVDVAALTTEALVDHLSRCREAMREAWFTHHRLNPVAMCALGDFLIHVHDWAGLAPSEVLPLMRGASAVSLGASSELEALVGQLQSRDDLKTLLASSDAPAVLQALQSAPGEAGAAARRYVDIVGVRIANGYDVADVSMGEMPQLLVDTIRAAVAPTGQSAADTLAADTARIRATIPEQHRAEFDELLAEARLTYRIRDERGYLNDAWSTGITRRALLEAGRRLVSSGRLGEASHAFDMTHAEIASALRGGPSPTADEIAAYANYRLSKTTADAPPVVGFAPSGPPPVEWLPPAAARMGRIIATVINEMFAKRDDTAHGEPLSGFGASPGEFIGTARLVLTASDMANVRPGEVLITRSTSPSYNALLPMIRGIVTDRGGTLSHAALVAREYGIPAVVGCGNATERIPNGATVRINGTTGTVHIVS
jgi:phosphohistidine swiveling domain-containing protein